MKHQGQPGQSHPIFTLILLAFTLIEFPYVHAQIQNFICKKVRCVWIMYLLKTPESHDLFLSSLIAYLCGLGKCPLPDLIFRVLQKIDHSNHLARWQQFSLHHITRRQKRVLYKENCVGQQRGLRKSEFLTKGEDLIREDRKKLESSLRTALWMNQCATINFYYTRRPYVSARSWKKNSKAEGLPRSWAFPQPAPLICSKMRPLAKKSEPAIGHDTTKWPFTPLVNKKLIEW